MLDFLSNIWGVVQREYRHFVGDYVLNQNDIVEQRQFEDRVAFGGWSIDLHPPQGVYATESGSKHIHADGIYHIPYRSLYSVNVNNMLMAGRDISATHVAFGTTRVMATCAVIGEAAGTAAALCAAHNITPRELYEQRLGELQETMLRQDASIIGLQSQDSADYAKTAELTASSTLGSLKVEQSSGSFTLHTNIGLSFPVEPELNGLELLVDASEPTTLTVELWNTSRMENYVPHQCMATYVIPIVAGQLQWINVPLKWKPEQAQNAFVIIRKNDMLSLHRSNTTQFGVLVYRNEKESQFKEELESKNLEQLLLQWNRAPFTRTLICFRLIQPTDAYTVEKVIDGYQRPYGGPHLWSSALMSNESEWINLKWELPVPVKSVHLIFNDDVNEDLINLHHHRTAFEVIPELVKAYRLQAKVDGQWRTIVEMDHNRKRKVVHDMAEELMVEQLKLIIEQTNGTTYAQVIAIRVYGS